MKKNSDSTIDYLHPKIGIQILQLIMSDFLNEIILNKIIHILPLESKNLFLQNIKIVDSYQVQIKSIRCFGVNLYFLTKLKGYYTFTND